MRVGNNPNKSADALAIKPVVISVISHLPNLTTAYHSHRLEVVQTCMKTMRQGAGVDNTFIVWDNGSISELRRWIEFELKPDVFVQSMNIGKTAARTSIIKMLPPETIVSCSDDDMLFYNDWLSPQIDILKHFPNVASVTGYPVRTSFRWGNENTKEWAKHHAKVETGRFLPQEWEDDFAVSLGREIQWHRDYTINDVDVRARYKGMSVYLTSHHCQFIGYAGTLGKVPVYDAVAMKEERTFDTALDKIGLRLATTQRLCRHMGNVIDEKLRNEINALFA